MGIRRRGLLNGSRWYARENRMRCAFLASRGATQVQEIHAMAGCSEAQAELIAVARRLACIEVLDAYERGKLTFRQLWRACEYPGDLSTQQLLLAMSA